MRRNITVLVAVLAMLTLPAAAMAAEQPATMHLEGTVVTVTPDVLTLATPEGVRQFEISNDATVPSDLAPNEYVEVTYLPAGIGNLRITEVKRTQKPMEQATQSQMSSSQNPSQQQPYQANRQANNNATTNERSASQNQNAMTESGTLQSYNSEALVLDTSSGTEHFTMQPSTRYPYDLQAGDRVQVAYVNGNNDQRLVRDIDVTEHTANPRVAAYNGQEMRTELPQTGSDLPLVGLIGLLAVTAAGVVRLTLRS